MGPERDHLHCDAAGRMAVLMATTPTLLRKVADLVATLAQVSPGPTPGPAGFDPSSGHGRVGACPNCAAVTMAENERQQADCSTSRIATVPFKL